MRDRPGLAKAQVSEGRRPNASGNSSAFAVVEGGIDQALLASQLAIVGVSVGIDVLPE